MKSGNPFILWIFIFSFIVTLGCSTESTQQPCGGFCPEGYVCVQDRCQPADSSDGDTSEDAEADVVEDYESDGDADSIETEPEVEESCECSGISACCDGCHPINQQGECSSDGIDCTNDTCIDGQCQHLVAAEFCLIDDTCIADLADNPDNFCQYCDAMTQRRAWRNKPNDALCDDNNACTRMDLCYDGVCTGLQEIVCEALDDCHQPGTCAPETGECSNPEKVDGSPCNDDVISCTMDICEAGVCTHPVRERYCRIDGTCYQELEENPDNSCQHCDPQAIQDGWRNRVNGATCDDGNGCTAGDTCIDGSCEGGTAVSCDSPQQCQDTGWCEPATGLCTYPDKPNGIPCDDGDLCTRQDTCQQGSCSGDDPVICTALNDCHLVGTCDSATGLCSQPLREDTAACTDDGHACTSDTCMQGECTHFIESGYCLIDGLCYSHGDLHPDNLCQYCNAPQNPEQWFVKPDGSVCDASENDCIDTAYCADGACPSLPLPDGTACDDGRAETLADQCVNAECKGAPDYLWVHQFAEVSVPSVAADINHNIYYAASYTNPGSFDGVALPEPVGSRDIALVKYSSNGLPLWAKGYGDSSYNKAHGLATDGSGNVFLMGDFNSEIDLGEEVKTSTGSNIFIVKLNSEGIQDAATSFSPDSRIFGQSMVIDNQDNLYISGFFYQTISLGDDTLTAAGEEDAYVGDIFIAKFDNNLQIQWLKGFGGTGYDLCGDLDTDSHGNIYISGTYNGSFNLAEGIPLLNGDNAFFVAKLDPEAIPVWAHGYGDNGNVNRYEIAVDQNDEVLLAGKMLNTFSFIEGGSGNTFLLKLASTGNINWYRRFQTDSLPTLNTNGNNDIFLSGTIKSTSNLGGR